MADDGKSKVTKARCFVRVRPFTPEEAKVCPEDSPIPREVITWDGVSTLTVLDPRDDFRPRKNGTFNVEKVFWSFVDPEEPKGVVATQKDVYETLVSPMIPSIVAGFNAGFCVAGGPESGRIYSLYGEDVEGSTRGILPRFAEDIFRAFREQTRENSKLVAEVEAIDVTATDTYVDLLSQRRRGQPVEELKLINDPQGGVRLQGATQVELNSSADLINVLKQLQRISQKRTTTHSVILRFTELYDFTDPDNPTQSISKSRRVKVIFAALRSMSAAFQRCITVAVEHDTGENPLAKVPTRESAFTRLNPELFTQGVNLSVLSCVSPYYEHIKDTLATLNFDVSVRKLKCRPTLTQDESLVELRQLADEVKDLKVAVRKQSESMDVVQRELNSREVELMKQEAIHHDSVDLLQQSEQNKVAARVARSVHMGRTRHLIKVQNDAIVKEKKSINATHASKTSADKAIKAAASGTSDVKKDLQRVEDEIEEQKRVNARLQDEIAANEQRKKDMARMQAFINAAPEERREEVVKTSGQHAQARQAMQVVETENQAAKSAYTSTKEQYDSIKPEYDVVYAAEKSSREKVELKKEITQLEKDIAALDAEAARLQTELDNQPKGCCTTM